MPNTHTTLTSLFSDIADSIRAKTGSSADIVADNFPTEIMNIPTGGTVAVPSSDVNFIDYDGTVLYAYTKEDFANLTELPENPSHAGLVAQGWNWSLSDAKIYVSTYGFLDIGQSYTTDDGKTRVYISLTSKYALSPTIHYYQSASNGVTVDWGDGSSSTTQSGSGNKSEQHTYPSIGDYVIKLTVNRGFCRLGTGSTSLGFIGGDSSTICYTNSIKKIEIGTGVIRLSSNCFFRCFSMESITIPNTVTQIYQQAIRTCRTLKGLVLPNSDGGVTYNDYPIYQCESLRRVSFPKNTILDVGGLYGCYSLVGSAIPDELTSIGNYMFYQDYSLVYLKFPSGITSIGTQAFYQCYSVRVYDFTLSASVPTLTNANAFTSINADCKIVVPDNLYDSWIADSVWSGLASNIIKESDWT